MPDILFYIFLILLVIWAGWSVSRYMARSIALEEMKKEFEKTRKELNQIKETLKQLQERDKTKDG